MGHTWTDTDFEMNIKLHNYVKDNNHRKEKHFFQKQKKTQGFTAKLERECKKIYNLR